MKRSIGAVGVRECLKFLFEDDRLLASDTNHGSILIDCHSILILSVGW